MGFATSNAKTSFDATNYLIRSGLQRVAIIAGTEGISTLDEREEGFRKAMIKAILVGH